MNLFKGIREYQITKRQLVKTANTKPANNDGHFYIIINSSSKLLLEALKITERIQEKPTTIAKY